MLMFGRNYFVSTLFFVHKLYIQLIYYIFVFSDEISYEIRSIFLQFENN